MTLATILGSTGAAFEALFIPFRGVYFVSYGVGARRGSRN
jgi:hypothetical protein